MVTAISYLLNTLKASGIEDLHPRILKEQVKVMIGNKWRSREAWEIKQNPNACLTEGKNCPLDL